MLLGLGNHHNLRDVRMVKMASNMVDKSVKPLTPMSHHVRDLEECLNTSNVMVNIVGH